MGNLDLNNAVVGTFHSEAYSNPFKSTDFYSDPSTDTDGATGEETNWTPEWKKWHGYYEDVPIFAAVIDTLAAWAVGRGIKGKDFDKVKNIRGWGKDDFNSIIENLLRTCLICGDSHSEKIKDKAGRLTNLKPLNPGTIKHVVNAFGILERYEQTLGGYVQRLDKDRIFHLCWNRLADEIHGKPLGARAEPIIIQIKQLQEDLGIRFHRITKPLRLFEAKTDDEDILSATEVKLKTSYKNAEIIVIPEGTLSEKEGMPTPSAQDTLIYLDYLTRNLVTAMNCPEIIMGWSKGSTEAGGKIVYLAFQQPTERKQLFLEEQMRLQLGLELEFEFPASLEEQMTTPPVTGELGTETPKVSTPASDLGKSKKINNVGGE